jgi:4-diphosphocytidyl-2-C-methyl-D-erythritol kinase
VRLPCPAKLNLFLEVLGRRPDGYHDIATVMLPVDLCDTLEVREARRFSLAVEGTRLPGLNTVEKAWRAVAKRKRIPAVCARIVKRIPAGSGLGGGSSDGAAMIEALDRLFDLGLDRHEVAAAIGSDVNFFLERGPALCTGRGEITLPLSLPPLHAVIVWPGFSLSTASVYARVLPAPHPQRALEFLDSFARERSHALFNRLETAAFALHPELAALRKRLRKYLPEARMTGSGSALYGLCDSGTEARRLAQRIGSDLGGFTAPVRGMTRAVAWRSKIARESQGCYYQKRGDSSAHE